MMKRDNSLRFLFEIMDKIDDTYPGDNGANTESDNGNAEQNTDGVPDSVGKGRDNSDIKDEPVRIGNKPLSKAASVRTYNDVKDFDIKFTKGAGVGRIYDDAEENDDNGVDDFWSKPYVDTLSNLQKIAGADVDFGSKLSTYVDQFRVYKDNNGVYRPNDGVNNPSSFIPGAGKSGNAGNNKGYMILEMILKLFRRFGLADMRINEPIDFVNYLSNTLRIPMPEFQKTVNFKKVIDAIISGYDNCEALKVIPMSELETLRNNIASVDNDDLDSFKEDGLSNAQARFFVNVFDGTVPVKDYNGKTIKKSIGYREFVGLLNWLPENTAKLRSVSYLTRRMRDRAGGFDKIKPVRDFIFNASMARNGADVSLFKHRRIIINGIGGPVDFNEYLDDPATDKSAEDLMSEATYVLSKALDAYNKNVPGENRLNFKQIFKNVKGYSSNNISYSVMDYIVNLSTILANQWGTRANEGTSTGIRLIFERVLSRYFGVMKTLNSYLEGNGDTFLSIVPTTAFFEDNDGIAYLNSLLSNADEKSKAVLLKTLRIANSKTKSASIYRLKLPRTDGNIELGVSESENIEEVGRPTLFELFNEILGEGKNSTQEKLRQSLKDYLVANGFDGNLVGSEWNNDNAGNADKAIIDTIGKKSVDITLNDYKILIEYQGEQHYTPSCCRGISPKLTGIGDNEVNDIHTSRGRTSEYIKKSLGTNFDDEVKRVGAEYNLPNYGKFLNEDDFSKRMTSLVDEIIEYGENYRGIKPNVVKKNEFLRLAWDYLGTFVKNNIIIDEDIDLTRISENDRDLKMAGELNRKKIGSWEHWGTVTSLISRRRWYEEILVFMQQAADKQKFIALKERGWNFFYVCPPGGEVTDNLVQQQADVQYVTDFTSFMGNDGEKTIDSYVSKDSLVNEGIYKIQGKLRPEFMASNFTYRFAANGSLDSTMWIRPLGAEDGYLGNLGTLGQTIMSIVKKERGR